MYACFVPFNTIRTHTGLDGTNSPVRLMLLWLLALYPGKCWEVLLLKTWVALVSNLFQNTDWIFLMLHPMYMR